MLKGYTLPCTPRDISSLVPAPPWHYVGNALADNPYLDLPDLRPAISHCWSGYRFSFALTVDDLVHLVT
jgi:hypothetical protein